MRENMLPYYPLGVYKDVVAEGFANAAEAALKRAEACPLVNPEAKAEGFVSSKANVIAAQTGSEGGQQ